MLWWFLILACFFICILCKNSWSYFLLQNNLFWMLENQRPFLWKSHISFGSRIVLYFNSFLLCDCRNFIFFLLWNSFGIFFIRFITIVELVVRFLVRSLFFSFKLDYFFIHFSYCLSHPSALFCLCCPYLDISFTIHAKFHE